MAHPEHLRTAVAANVGWRGKGWLGPPPAKTRGALFVDLGLAVAYAGRSDALATSPCAATVGGSGADYLPASPSGRMPSTP
jgi:hypothetical protein